MVMTVDKQAVDPKLLPPHILAQVLHEIDHNRDFDMGGYSVPCTAVFEQFGVYSESMN